MSDNILVCVRLRPLIPREVSDNAAIHWQRGEDNTITQIDPVTQKAVCPPYKFDRVYGMEYDNSDIYFEVAEGIVEATLSGFNGTIFAYGQTSSGKTYTMMGDKKDPGVIPLAIQNIFQSIENNPNREYLIRVSYMEIYNETITDLLAGRDQKGKGLAVREDVSGAVFVVDLKEECVNSEEMLLALMKKGNKNRHVGMTNMNDKSSRSHTIFRLILESRERTEGDGADEAVAVSHLNLVDLAGSENASQTGATGERLKEGGFINKSLFMLGRVISQLSEGEQFINFRDSKLTRILQSSLGGNAKTAIISTVTPVGIEQTHSTLRFASRAKSIKNKPVVNEVLSEAALLKRYAKEIKNLQQSLEKERKTDKAQEMEQVREMLDEKERKNQELLQKINELKTKLVVSSLPKEPQKPGIDKKKKQRRETWAAPRAMRAMRMSMAPLRIEPVKLDSNFLQPVLPPWTPQGGRISEESSGYSDYGDNNSSMVSDGFGREDSFTMDLAEQSKLGKLENSLDQGEHQEFSSKSLKRVHFRFSNHEHVVDAECQTDDVFTPQLRLLPQAPQTPGTPVSVLRSRNVALKEELNEKETWLKDWKNEIKELSEFQKNEISVLEENFQRKVAEGPVDYSKLEEKEKEIRELKRSLSDSEKLLLDANCDISKKTQELSHLKVQVEELTRESLKLNQVEKDFELLQKKFEDVTKVMDKKEERLSQLENERQDFDMMMELALQKQRVKETDLRKSLDDAWKEIAEHEKGDVEEVKKRHERYSILETEVVELRQLKSSVEDEQTVATLKKQLEESLTKQEEYKEMLEQQASHLSLVSSLEAKVREMESQISEIEILKVELNKAESEVKSFEKENASLKKDLNFLQPPTSAEGESDDAKRIQELELEVETLREKLEEAETAEFAISTPPQNPDVTLTSRISRKLSETLQALEESIMLPCTPRKDSSCFSSEPFVNPHDVALIKQQLLALQEALVVQEQQYQAHREKESSHADTALNHKIYSEITAGHEAEANVWRLVESLYGDYISHIRDDSCSKVPFKDPITQDITQTAIGLKVDMHTGYGNQCKEEQTAQETRLSQEAGVEVNNLYMSPACGETTSVVSMEMTMNDEAEMSLLDTPRSQQNEHALAQKDHIEMLKEKNHSLVEQLNCLKRRMTTMGIDSEANDVSAEFGDLQTLKDQVRILKEENSNLASQLECLQRESEECQGTNSEASDVSLEFGELKILKDQVKILKEENSNLASQLECVQKANGECQGTSVENVTRESNDDSFVTAQKSFGRAMSLADELSEAAMHNMSSDDTFETSVLEVSSVIPEVGSMKRKVEMCKNDSLVSGNKIIVSPKIEDSPKLLLSDADGMLATQNENLVTLKEEVQTIQLEKITLENEIEKLKDELSNARMVEEEVHSLRWQVNSLKEENSGLEEDLKSYEDNRKNDDENATDNVLVELKELKRLNESLVEERERLAREMEAYKEKMGGVKDSEGLNTEGDVSALSTELERVQEENKIMESKLKSSKDEFECMKEELTMKVNLLKELEDKCEALKRSLTEKTNDLEMTKKQLTSHQEVKDEQVNREISLQITIEEKETEILTMRERMTSLEEELKNQQKSLEEKMANALEEKESELEAMITNFMEKEEALENKLQELKEKGDVAGKDNSTTMIETEIETMREKCVSLQSIVDSLRSSLLEKESESLSLKEVCRKLEDEKENMQDKCVSLQDAIENLESTVAKKESQSESLKEACQKLESDLTDISQQHEDELQEMRDKVQSYEACKADHENILEALKKLCEEKQTKIELMEEDQHKVEDKLNAVIATVEEQKCLLSEKEKEREAVANSYEQLLAENKTRVTETHDSNGTIDQDILKKLDEFEKLKNEFSAKVLECTQLGDSLSNLEILKAKSEEKFSQIDKEYQEEITSYMGALTSKEEQIQSLEMEAKEKAQKISSLTSAIEAKDSKLKNLQNDLEDMKRCSERNLAENEELMMNNLKDMSDKVKELESEIERLTRGSEEMKEDREKMMEALHEKEREVTQVSRECESLKVSLQNVDEEKDNLHAEVTKKTLECDHSVSELERLQREVCGLTEERDKLQNELESKNAEMLEKDQVRNTLEEEREKMKEEISNLKTEMTTKNEQHQTNIQQIENLVGIIEKVEGDVAAKDSQLCQALNFEVELKEKEEVLKELRKDRESLMSELNEVNSALGSLKGENEDLRNHQNKMEKDAANNMKMLEGLGKGKEELALAEDKLSKLQSKYDSDMEHLKNELMETISAKEELTSMLTAKEEELQQTALRHRDEMKDINDLKEMLNEKTCLVEKLTSELSSLKEELSSILEVSKASELKILQQSREIQVLKSDKDKEEEERKSQQTLTSQQIESLVKIVEKFESELSEKQEQMAMSEATHKNEIAEKGEKLRNLSLEIESKVSQIKDKDAMVNSAEKINKELSQKVCDLDSKFAEIEEQLKLKEEMLAKTLEELREKEDDNRNMGEELQKTKEKLSQSSLSASVTVATDEGDQTAVIQTLKEELTLKEQECAELNEEMDELVKHYRNEEKLYTSELTEMREKCERTQIELSETKAMLQEVTQIEENASRLGNTSHSVSDQKSSLHTEISTLKKHYLNLKEKYGDLESKSRTLEETNERLQEEIKMGSSSTTTLMKKLGDLENLKMTLVTEKEDLVKKVNDYECEIVSLRKSLLKQDAREQIENKNEAAAKEKVQMTSTLTEDNGNMGEELHKTKEKLSQSSLSASVTVATDDDDQTAVIQTLKEKLTLKEQECAELNEEMDELVKHYRNEEKLYTNELTEMRERCERTQIELSETKAMLQEVTQIEENASRLGNTSQEKYSDLESKSRTLEQTNESLQEEIKIGSSSTTTLMKKLGDLENLKMTLVTEKEDLVKKVNDYECEIVSLRKSLLKQDAGKQMDDPLQKVKCLETQSLSHQRNFESVADECSIWKMQYTKQFEECQNLKENLAQRDSLIEKQKVEFEEKVEDLKTHLNTVMNKTSLSDTSSMDVSSRKNKSRIAVLEEQRSSMLQENANLVEKNKTLEDHLNNLRRSGGVVSYVEDFEIELSFMKKKLAEVEQERDTLNRNYDVLEKAYEELQEQEALDSCSEIPSSHASGDASSVEKLQKENAQLVEEITLLKQMKTIKAKESCGDNEETNDSMEDRIAKLKCENNELRLRLRALNAPAEKEVQTLKEELSIANGKVNHLKAELRRIQNTNNVDTTVCEMRGILSAAQVSGENQSSEAKYDYNSTSGVISDVQVMVLKNKVYHLEKENKKLSHEHKSLEQHVDHYKGKAQEWKDTAMKEKRAIEKLKKEMEAWRTETARLNKEMEENKGRIEMQLFEIGSQRERIEKLEKGRSDGHSHNTEDRNYPKSSVASDCKAILNTPLKVEGTSSSASCGKEDSQSTNVESIGASRLRHHNAPLPSQTRVERLEFAKTPSNPQKTDSGREPLWQSAYKENKDYSKYKLPPGSTQKRKDEECKTQ